LKYISNPFVFVTVHNIYRFWSYFWSLGFIYWRIFVLFSFTWSLRHRYKSSYFASE